MYSWVRFEKTFGNKITAIEKPKAKRKNKAGKLALLSSS